MGPLNMIALKFLLISSCAILAKSYDLQIVEVAKDLLNNDKSPTKIVAFTCWEKEKQKHFITSLRGYLTSVRTNNSLLELHQQKHQQTFLLDSKCRNYKTLLEQAQKLQLFSFPFRWIFLGNIEDIPIYLDLLIDSRFYVIKETSHSRYVIKSIYKIAKEHNEFIEKDIAVWATKFLYYNEMNLIKDRYNLFGLTVNVSYVITNSDSLNHLTDYRDKHIDSITKFNYLLSNTVFQTMNATGNFLLTDAWGIENTTTGIYSGMVGDLQTRKAELAATPAFFDFGRMRFIEYIAPTTPTIVMFIFRAPPLSYVKNVFKLPFSRGVWYGSFLLVVLICVVVSVIAKWEWTDEEFKKTLKNDRNALKPNFMDSVVLGLGAICQQGSEEEPKSVAGKIAVLFAFVTLMFLYTSYSANIVALLQSTSDNIHTVNDLLNSKIKLGVELVPYSKYYFETATDYERKTLYEQKIAPKGSMVNFMDIEAGIKKMREEFFAFHVEATRGYKVISDTFLENEKCGLKGIRIWQVKDPWIAVAKNTSYKELFKFGFRKLHETGVQNREYKRLFVKKPVCQGTGSIFVSVGLVDCYYPFMIFGIGVVISILLLLLEQLIHRKQKKMVAFLKDTKIYHRQKGVIVKFKTQQ